MILLAFLACNPEADPKTTEPTEPVEGGVNGLLLTCDGYVCIGALSMHLSALDGTPATGLDLEDFKVEIPEIVGLADGLAYAVDAAPPERLDAEVVEGGYAGLPVLLDQSCSMRDTDPSGLRFDAAALLAATLLDPEVAAPHQLALASFPRALDQGDFEETDLITDFTRDLSEIEADLATLLGEETGSTPLYDSMLEILTWQDDTLPQDAERALVVLTDGDDSGSAASADEVAAEAVARGLRLYVAGLSESVDVSELATMATETGGFFFPVDDASRLEGVFAGLSGAVYGSVTLSVRLEFAEGEVPTEAGWYHVPGEVRWNGANSELSMAIDQDTWLQLVLDGEGA